MSEKKIVVPEEGLKASDKPDPDFNPYDIPQPLRDRAYARIVSCDGSIGAGLCTDSRIDMILEEAKKFYQADPEVPEEIKDLLGDEGSGDGRMRVHYSNKRIIEAYRRGQKSTREIYRFGFTGFKPVDHPILTEWLADAKDKGVDQATQVNYRRLFERAFEAGKKEGHK
jgi:hypothetical protein